VSVLSLGLHKKLAYKELYRPHADSQLVGNLLVLFFLNELLGHLPLPLGERELTPHPQAALAQQFIQVHFQWHAHHEVLLPVYHLEVRVELHLRASG